MPTSKKNRNSNGALAKISRYSRTFFWAWSLPSALLGSLARASMGAENNPVQETSCETFRKLGDFVTLDAPCEKQLYVSTRNSDLSLEEEYITSATGNAVVNIKIKESPEEAETSTGVEHQKILATLSEEIGGPLDFVKGVIEEPVPEPPLLQAESQADNCEKFAGFVDEAGGEAMRRVPQTEKCTIREIEVALYVSKHDTTVLDAGNIYLSNAMVSSLIKHNAISRHSDGVRMQINYPIANSLFPNFFLPPTQEGDLLSKEVKKKHFQHKTRGVPSRLVVGDESVAKLEAIAKNQSPNQEILAKTRLAIAPPEIILSERWDSGADKKVIETPRVEACQITFCYSRYKANNLRIKQEKVSPEDVSQNNDEVCGPCPVYP